MATSKISKKKRSILITILSAVIMFVTSLVIKDNPVLQDNIGTMVNQVGSALSQDQNDSISIYSAD